MILEQRGAAGDTRRRAAEAAELTPNPRQQCDLVLITKIDTSSMRELNNIAIMKVPHGGHVDDNVDLPYSTECHCSSLLSTPSLKSGRLGKT